MTATDKLTERLATAGRGEPGTGTRRGPSPRARRLRAALLVAALALVAAVGLHVRAGRHAPPGPMSLVEPPFRLEQADGVTTGSGDQVPGFGSQDLLGEVTVINVFASWCPSCRSEHDTLMKLANQSRMRIFGIVFKDSPGNVAQYLREHGQPFKAVGMDPGFDLITRLGVRGVPTTVVVGRDGRTVATIPGELSERRMASELARALDRAEATTPPAAVQRRADAQ